MDEIISSLQNPRVRLWRTLNKSRAERLRAGLFLAEGEHMAGEAVKEGRARALLVGEPARERFDALARAARGVPVFYLKEHVMEALCDAKTPQGVIAVCVYPPSALLPENAFLLMALDGVQDPGNVGTLIRTLDAAGFHGLLLDEKTADPYAPKALRASMGGVFRVPAALCPSLPEALVSLRSRGFDIVAGDLRGEPFYSAGFSSARVCVVVGSEGQGVSPEVLALATHRLKLPIAGGAESLNAAVAGSIMVYDILRRRLAETVPFSP